MRIRDKNGTVFRVHKTQNYTVMSNHHLFNKLLPLKVKGLLSIMLALPPDWNFSINGLAALSYDGRDSVLNSLKVLQINGYLYLEKTRNSKGRFDTIYNIYEEPQENFTTDTENPTRNDRLGTTDAENQEQLNTNKLITNVLSTDKLKKTKVSFGEFNNVNLTDEQIEKLTKIYKSKQKLDEAIEILSSYKESSGKKYKNDYAVLGQHNWVYKKVLPKGLKDESRNNKHEDLQHTNYENVSRW